MLVCVWVAMLSNILLPVTDLWLRLNRCRKCWFCIGSERIWGIVGGIWDRIWRKIVFGMEFSGYMKLHKIREHLKTMDEYKIHGSVMLSASFLVNIGCSIAENISKYSDWCKFFVNYCKERHWRNQQIIYVLTSSHMTVKFATALGIF